MVVQKYRLAVCEETYKLTIFVEKLFKKNYDNFFVCFFSRLFILFALTLGIAPTNFTVYYTVVFESSVSGSQSLFFGKLIKLEDIQTFSWLETSVSICIQKISPRKTQKHR